MGVEQGIEKVAVEMGVFAAAHLGILACRIYRKSHPVSERTQQAILAVEHVVHHATLPLFFKIFLQSFGFQSFGFPENQSLVVAMSIFKGLWYDGTGGWPVTSAQSREGMSFPQFGQIFADISGALLYLRLFEM